MYSLTPGYFYIVGKLSYWKKFVSHSFGFKSFVIYCAKQVVSRAIIIVKIYL